MALRRAKDLRRRGVCRDVAAQKMQRRVGPQWPSFVGTATLVGTSGPVTVYYDATLGAQALQNATDLLAQAASIATYNNTLFGTSGGPVNVIVFALGGVTDGTGGADHDGCDYATGQDIEVDASYGQSIRVQALFEAELSECSMGGNLCGYSTGEALSRWTAAWLTNNALPDFATAPIWVQDGMPNWVDQLEQTDQDADSIGCGMVFLSWMISQGHTLSTIAEAMVGLGDNGTLAGLYAKLSGQEAVSAWTNFHAAIEALPGGAAGITSDDPFNALSSAPQQPVPVPPPAPPLPVPPQPAPPPSPPPAPQPPVPPVPAPVPGGVTTVQTDALETFISWYEAKDPWFLREIFPRNVRQAIVELQNDLD